MGGFIGYTIGRFLSGNLRMKVMSKAVTDGGARSDVTFISKNTVCIVRPNKCIILQNSQNLQKNTRLTNAS